MMKKKRIKKLFLDRQVREIDMSGNNRNIEEEIEKDLYDRLGLKVPVTITPEDEHTVTIKYSFLPKKSEGRVLGDKSLREEYLLVFINGEWKDYQAPNTIGLAPRFGGYFQIMIQPEEIEQIMKANNRDLGGSRIKTVIPEELDDGFQVKVIFG